MLVVNINLQQFLKGTNQNSNKEAVWEHTFKLTITQSSTKTNYKNYNLEGNYFQQSKAT